MIWFNATIALVGIVAVIINIISMVLTQRSRADSYTYLQQSNGKYLGFVIGGLNNMETLKSIGREHSFFDRLAGYFSQVTNTQQNLGKKNALLTSVPVLLNSLTTAALFGVGGYLIINEDFTLGLFMAMQALLNNFMSPVTRLLDLGNMMQMVQTNVTRLDDVLKNSVDPVFVETKKILEPYETIKGYLELKDITFGYSRLEPPLIENFNLRLKPGQRVAFVGSTGCGKTTIARLINGLFQPWSGEILIDGKLKSELSPNKSLSL